MVDYHDTKNVPAYFRWFSPRYKSLEKPKKQTSSIGVRVQIFWLRLDKTDETTIKCLQHGWQIKNTSLSKPKHNSFI